MSNIEREVCDKCGCEVVAENVGQVTHDGVFCDDCAAVLKMKADEVNAGRAVVVYELGGEA